MALRREPAKPQAFLDIEAGLSRIFISEWRKKERGITKRVNELVRANRFAEAMEVTERIDLGPAARRNRKAMETFGMAAVLFGAQQATRSRTTIFTGEGMPEIVELAADVLEATYTRGFNRFLQPRAVAQIQRAERGELETNPEGSAAAKAELIPGVPAHVLKASFVKPFASFMQANGDSFINIGASLHTSRMSVWGFEMEAQARGLTWYEIDEVLDSRTCPVCRHMDGKVFPVGSSAPRIEQQLKAGAENDEDALKAFPWPAQSQEAVEQFVKLGDEDLVTRGWNSPPFHPRCRGIVRQTTKTGTIQPSPPTPSLGEPPPLARDGIRRALQSILAAFRLTPDDPDGPGNGENEDT